MIIYLTRHGESLYNTKKLLGGNSGLSEKGKIYSKKLFEYFQNDLDQLNIITSNLIRTKQTGQYFKINNSFNFLDEINAGIFDGKTYKYVKENYPDEYKKRKEDKYNYIYPEGESYKQLQKRVLKVIAYLKKDKINLIICHNAVLRVLYAYFNKINNNDLPHLEIPLHTLYKFKIDKNNININSIEILDGNVI